MLWRAVASRRLLSRGGQTVHGSLHVRSVADRRMLHSHHSAGRNGRVLLPVQCTASATAARARARRATGPMYHRAEESEDAADQTCKRVSLTVECAEVGWPPSLFWEVWCHGRSMGSCWQVRPQSPPGRPSSCCGSRDTAAVLVDIRSRAAISPPDTWTAP